MTSPIAEPSAASALAFRRHDHRTCRAAGLGAARRLCEERRLRLTASRERVLGYLLESHRALGAYDVLARLEEDGRPAQPPLAYRALDFLVANGLAHRIERLNAYVACCAPGEGHEAAFLICRLCRRVGEAPATAAAAPAERAAAALGFAVEARTVEVEGVCALCREAKA